MNKTNFIHTWQEWAKLTHTKTARWNSWVAKKHGLTFFAGNLSYAQPLGGAGLGLTGKNSTSTITLLALIPLGCAYVDLLCTNINLRIILIGRYLSTKNDPLWSICCTSQNYICSWGLGTLWFYYSYFGFVNFVFFYAIFYIYFFIKMILRNNLCIIESIVIIISSVITIILSKWIIKSYDILLNHKTAVGEDKACKKNISERTLRKRFLFWISQ